MATLEGIDISEHNGTPSPALLSTLKFAVARASYGNEPDQKYRAHTASLRGAKLLTGAYHFGVGWCSPEVQAATFLKAAAKADFLVLDLEVDSTLSMTWDQAKRFIALIHEAGRKVTLYASRSGFPTKLGQDYNWIADYTAAARVIRRPLTRVRWDIWQYQSRNPDGTHPLDRNKFNGDLNALRRFASNQRITPVTAPAPIVPAPPVPAKSAPVVRRVRVAPGSWWDYSVVGNRTTGYRITGRKSRRTAGGFSASYVPLPKPWDTITWSHADRRLVQLTTSAYKESWIDLNDTLVTLINA